MRKDKVIFTVFILFLISCKPFTEVSTKDRYKKTWTGRQFRKHSCIRQVRETIKDTVENYIVQRTWEKRHICGFYAWPIKLCTITYNKQNKPIEKHVVKRGRYDTKKINKTITYQQNYNGLTNGQIEALIDLLNKID